MIYLVRSSLFDRDVRGSKYHKSLVLEGINVNVVCWNRLQEISAFKGHFFRRKAPFGQRWKNIWNVLLWQLFLLETLFKNRKNFQVLHVADLDSALPCLFMRLFGKKVFYDVYDLFCDSYFSDTNSLSYKFFRGLEAWIISKADLTIIADKTREDQIEMAKEKVLVIENVPFLKMPTIESHSSTNYPLKISYTGTLQSQCRGLEDLLLVVSKFPAKLKLEIAGDGQLKTLCEEYAARCPNIVFHGRKNHDECLSIMAKSDYIFAAYYPNFRNNIFAAPNKYYESLMVGTPIITNNGTYFSKKVANQQLGFIFEPNPTSLEKVMLDNTLLHMRESLSQHCLKQWNDSYSNYVVDIIHGQYVEKVKKELKNGP